ncbi:Arm DNA-binding domain-containing protein [Luteibacter sp. E-22]|uniref:Arm DNA-binding domain-containing protein n=1 Tax=Luteibacter sp. E-22 TaxID=3404050 RepID=UPI003CF485D9
MGRRTNGVRPATASSIGIDFYYQGVRCRERIKLAPTKANQKFVENLKAQILSEIARGTFDYAKYFPDSPRAKSLAKLPGAAVTVGDALDLWLRGKASELSYTTYRDYELAIKNVWKPAMGTTRLPDLTRARLKEWVSGTSCGLKRISNLLLPMRGMYDQALDDGLIAVNPFVGWTPKKVEPPKEEDDVDPFTQAEVAAILGACEGQVRNLFQFAFWTGLRTSELIALRWEDVDLVNGTVTIRRAKVRKRVKAPKTRAGRRLVTLLKPAADALAAQRQYTQLAGAEVFMNPRTGESWLHDGPIRKTAWQPALKRAGVRYRYPYQTRHTFASTLLSAGENPVWVASMMGHKDWAMIIKVYGRWIPSIAPDAGNKVAALWTSSSCLQGSGKA